MRTLLSIAALCALLASPGVSRAQDEDAEITKMAKEHYKLGLDAFKAGKYPEAIKELKKAYLLKRLPPLLINIAKTYEKIGDVDNEVYYYKKYLAEAPEAKDRDAIRQALADLDAAKSGVKPPPPPEEAPAPVATSTRRTRPVTPPPEEQQPEAPPPPRGGRRPAPEPAEAAVERPAPTPPPVDSAPMPTEWTHMPLDAAPPSKPVDVRVQTPVMKGVKVFLSYRGKGQPEYTTVEMKRRGPEKIARIPADVMQGKSIQYFIEAKDSTGNVVKSSGSVADPNIVMIDPNAAPQLAVRGVSAVTPEESERPEEQTPPEVKRKKNLDEEAAPMPGEAPRKHKLDDENPLLGKRSGDGKQGGKKTFSTLGWVGVGMAALGVAMAAIAAPVMFYFAQQYAQSVHDDANHVGTGGQPDPYVFNDPSVAPNDNDFQRTGKILNYSGIGMIGLGGALVIAGGALAILDYVKLHPGAPKAKPVKKRRRRRPVQDEENQDEAPRDDLPPTETSQASPIRNLIAAPYVAPNGAGVSLGFQF